MVHVSVTGIRLHSIWRLPRFVRHTVPAMRQARSAPGNLFAQARRIDGVFHTLTVWTDQAAMRAFLTSGAHLQAMRAMAGIGTGSTLGYPAEAVPDWKDAYARWQSEGRPVGQRPFKS